MSNVIVISAVRAERLKQALAIHARNGESVIVETSGGRIYAEKIACRNRFVELLDRNGDYRVIGYDEIRALHSVIAQTSVVNARGEFMPAFSPTAATRPAAILPFSHRGRRR